MIGIEERTPSTTTRKYLHRDPLGSVVAVSGEAQSGNAPLLAEYSFDAWGRQRNPADWTATTNNLTTAASGDRGFTGHEMLDGINLVHMNGRIYSQELGRFLSPDPLIQAPENLQSFNRYSYVFNNPLTHTDPSGFKTKSKAAASSAATASTQLAEAVSSTEISSQDNVGGNTTESSEQVDDYYSDGVNTQVDQTTKPTATTTKPGDENIGSTANAGDKNGYGDSTATTGQNTGQGGAKPSDPTLAATAGETTTKNPNFVNGAATDAAKQAQGGDIKDSELPDWASLMTIELSPKKSQSPFAKDEKSLKDMLKLADSRAEDPLALDPRSSPLSTKEKLLVVGDLIGDMASLGLADNPFDAAKESKGVLGGIVDVTKGAVNEFEHVRDSVPNPAYNRNLIPGNDWESLGR